jgi:hypothetical protein
MNKLFFSLALVSVFALSSCQVSLTTAKLNKKYDNVLIAKSIKENIKIYESEAAIDRPFTVLSVNTYGPLIVIPIFRSYKSVMYKKFYKVAVLKANSTKGDAVLIEGVGHYKVIKFN